MLVENESNTSTSQDVSSGEGFVILSSEITDNPKEIKCIEPGLVTVVIANEKTNPSPWRDRIMQITKIIRRGEKGFKNSASDVFEGFDKSKEALKTGKLGDTLGKFTRKSLNAVRTNINEFKSAFDTGNSIDENVEIAALAALENSVKQNELLLAQNKQIESKSRDRQYQIWGLYVFIAIIGSGTAYQYLKPPTGIAKMPTKAEIKEVCEAGAESLEVGNISIKCPEHK
jgi:hypothetical protein